MTSDDLATFRRALRRAGARLARDLPWIGESPWAILVSEVMLQQTSTARVREPWRRFMTSFPTVEDCAGSPLDQVLQAWSGLGYPRRAKALHDASRQIVREHHGRVPEDLEELRRLPGVGPYTAHAVATFAFGRNVAVLDTNVGRVLARALANAPLTRGEAQRLAQDLLPRRDASAFNQSMLDLGAQFCRATPRCVSCPVRSHCRWLREGGEDPAPRSAAVSRRQATFDGSDRQLRGRVLRLLGEGALSSERLCRDLEVAPERMRVVVGGLERDGLIARVGRRYELGAGAPVAESAAVRR